MAKYLQKITADTIKGTNVNLILDNPSGTIPQITISNSTETKIVQFGLNTTTNNCEINTISDTTDAVKLDTKCPAIYSLTTADSLNIKGGATFETVNTSAPVSFSGAPVFNSATVNQLIGVDSSKFLTSLSYGTSSTSSIVSRSSGTTSFSGLTLNGTSNQILMGSAPITINASATSARTYGLGDCGGSANFVMSSSTGAQTIGSSVSISGNMTLGGFLSFTAGVASASLLVGSTNSRYEQFSSGFTSGVVLSMDSNSTNNGLSWRSVGSLMPSSSYAIVQESYTTGTNNTNSATGGGWKTRAFNTITTSTFGTNLALNTSTAQVTLSAGTYFARANCVYYKKVGGTKIRIYNVTDTATINYGDNASLDINQDTIMLSANITSIFTIATSKALRIEHWVANTVTNPFGVAVGASGAPEIYATWYLEKKA